MVSTSLAINVEAPRSKRRRVGEKSVVAVRVEATSTGKPADLWSWRKYGQKSIKGSPYPRGYYRCSTWKGCSARKHVERCKTDASVLIITYTSGHNHPSLKSPSAIVSATAPPLSQCQYLEEDCDAPNDTNPSKGVNDIEEEQVNTSDLIAPFSSSPCGDNDFFDELEELPMSSSPATTLRIGNLFDERVLFSSQNMPLDDVVWAWPWLF